jgi:DNA-binding GntR family transcriptional regulator
MQSERPQENKAQAEVNGQQARLRTGTNELLPLETDTVSILDTSSLSSRVYDRLLRAIVRREFPSGQPLRVDALADTFGVSRTPVLAAISRLAEFGLVEVRPRRGTFVTTITAQDVRELFDIRCLIELHSVKKVIHLASGQELMAVRDIGAELREFFSGDQYTDYHAFLERDMQFHSAIVTLAGNRRLVKMYDQVRILIELGRASAEKHMPGAGLTIQRHMAIVEALLARDTVRATEALERHTRESEEAILARLHLPER